MTTLDYQVGAGADDGNWYATTFAATGTSANLGRYTTGVMSTWARFPTVTIPDGATIDTAYLSFYCFGKAGTPVNGTLKFDDQANPSAISSIDDWNSRTKTTASISYIPSYSADGWYNSGSIVSILEELMASYSFAGGAAMQMMFVGAGSSGDNRVYIGSYERTGNVYGPKLHIEYTEASTDPEGSLVAGKLIRGGLLLHGVLGRS